MDTRIGQPEAPGVWPDCMVGHETVCRILVAAVADSMEGRKIFSGAWKLTARENSLKRMGIISLAVSLSFYNCMESCRSDTYQAHIEL